jgi:hypothetical protein
MDGRRKNGVLFRLARAQGRDGSTTALGFFRFFSNFESSIAQNKTMLRLFFILNALVLSLLPISLAAQKGLSGLWEGTITEGGLHAKDGHRLELYLRVQDRHIKGQSYIYVSKDSIITRQLSGRIYDDSSVYLEEVPPTILPGGVPSPQSQAAPNGEFSRKYQFVFKRSIWDSSLQGYWQEITDEVFSRQRQLGRIILKKKPLDTKA